MEREKVKNILMFCRDIDGEIKLNAKIIQDYEDKYYYTGGAILLDAIPKGGKYNTSSPTESAALNVPDFVSVEIRRLQEHNEQLGNLKAAIMQELSKLNLTHKNILYDFYIKDLQWVQISAQRYYSATQCKKIRNRGLDNLAKYFVETC